MADQPTIASLITQIKHGDTIARTSAVLQAQLIGTDAIGPLGAVYAGKDAAASRAACEAIKHIVYNAGRPSAPTEAKAASVALLKLTAPNYPRFVRADAIEGLGVVGGIAEATELAKLLSDKDVSEDARLAIERIPGPEVDALLKLTARTSSKEGRAAIDLSLKHRHKDMKKIGIK